jgi:cytidylate kinase
MPTDALKAIDTLIRSQFSPEFARKNGLPPKPLVVTVSRDYGSGGREIAQMLAQQMGVELYDKELLNAVVEKSGIDLRLMERLDEKTRGFFDSWILSLLSGENVLEENYRRHLVKVVLGILNTGGVIIGRGAHIILAKRRVLRVRVTASPEVCARRIAYRKGISPEDARKRVDSINEARARFVWDMFKHRLNDPNSFDLTINTDRLDRSEDVVEMILFALLRYLKEKPAESAHHPS